MSALRLLRPEDAGELEQQVERVDRNLWRRQGQESLLVRRQEIWQHPLVLSAHNWWDGLPEMAAFREALDAQEVLRTRVDTMVGFTFGTTRRHLKLLLILDPFRTTTVWALRTTDGGVLAISSSTHGKTDVVDYPAPGSPSTNTLLNARSRTVPISFTIQAQGVTPDGTPGLVINQYVPNVLNGRNLGTFNDPTTGAPVPGSMP